MIFFFLCLTYCTIVLIFLAPLLKITVVCVCLFPGSLFCPVDLHACDYHADLIFVCWLYILIQKVMLISSAQICFGYSESSVVR